MSRNRLNAERGESIIGIIIAAAAFVLVVTTVFAASGTAAKGVTSAALDRADASSLEHVAYQVRREGTDALAFFVPATDVLGTSNADGHAFGAYFRNGQTHAPTFVEYVCTGDCAIGATHTGGSLQRYIFTTWANPASTLQKDGPPVTGVSLNAAYLPASQLTNPAVSTNAAFFAAQFAAAGISSIPDRLVNVGYPGISAGNQLTVVKLQSRTNAYELHLLPLAVPTVNNGVIVGYYTPTPNALCVYTGACGQTALTFPGRNSLAQPFHATEVNYPATSSYTESDTCAGLVTIAASGSPTGPNPTWIVTPTGANPSGGTCTATITDITQQSGAITISVGADQAVFEATCPAQPSGTLISVNTATQPPTDYYANGTGNCAQPPPASINPLVITPSSLNFSSDTAGAQSATISEAGYTGAFSYGGNCGGSGYYNAGGGGTSGPSETFSFSPLVNNVSCIYIVTDSNGQTATLTMSTGAPPPMINPLIISPSSLTFATDASGAQSATVSEAGYTGPISFGGTCGGSGDYNFTGGGTNGPSITFSFTPAVNGVSCYYTAYDSNGQSATLTMTTGTPVSAPSSAPSTAPSAAPSAIVSAIVDPCPPGELGAPPNCYLPSPSPVPPVVNVNTTESDTMGGCRSVYGGGYVPGTGSWGIDGSTGGANSLRAVVIAEMTVSASPVTFNAPQGSIGIVSALPVGTQSTVQSPLPLVGSWSSNYVWNPPFAGTYSVEWFGPTGNTIADCGDVAGRTGSTATTTLPVQVTGTQ